MELEDCLAELVDDQDFSDLDRRFGRFNLFEAMGAVRRELEHSNFLAYLLSPERPHGFGAEFLRRTLRAFIEKTPRNQRPVRPLDIAIGDIDEAVVHREQDNIDVLIEVPSLELIVLIENKVGAKASEGQLDRYKARVKASYPGWRPLLVFLTPDGADPEDEDYLAFSYVELAAVIEEFSIDGASTRSDEMALVLKHYLEMLRRHVVQDENLRAIALRIYERHKEAIDFIIDSLPEPGSLLGELRDPLNRTGGIVQDRHISSILRFAPEAWSDAPALNACPPDIWTKTGRNVLFEVKSFKTQAYDFSDRVLLSLILGPSEATLREYIFKEIRSKPNVFRNAGSSIGKSWATIFSRELLTAAAAKRMTDEEKSAALEKAWGEFASNDLPVLTRAMLEIVAQLPEHN